MDTNKQNSLQSLFTLQQTVQTAQPGLGIAVQPVGTLEDSVHFLARKPTLEEKHPSQS